MCPPKLEEHYSRQKLCKGLAEERANALGNGEEFGITGAEMWLKQAVMRLRRRSGLRSAGP